MKDDPCPIQIRTAYVRVQNFCDPTCRWRSGTRSDSSTDLALVDGDPVGGLEPLVVLDVVDAVLQVAVALRQVDL